MALLESCCWWRSVRRGSYASAIYTMVSIILYPALGGLPCNNQFTSVHDGLIASEMETVRILICAPVEGCNRLAS